MTIDRRNMLFGAVAVAASPSAAGGPQLTRISQQELNEAIRLHAMWRVDINAGQRCVFTGRDLSGLSFGHVGGPIVNLSGADFTQADLSGTEADDILFHHCSFNGAKLDESHWRQPVLAYADLRRASAKRVRWGKSDPRGLLEPLRADFSHAALHGVDLEEAKISGFFYGTKLVGASLVQADFSHSSFLGEQYCETIFSGAQLKGAKLRHCQISSASFYYADCANVDFSHTDFSNVRMKGCNLSDACFSNATFERWMMTAD